MTAILFSIGSFASQPKEISTLKKLFDKYNVDGSILIYNQKSREYLGYNLDRCNIGFCPASTFKIPNTLIALECGVVTLDSVFKWNGEKRAFQTWERDMTLSEAFKLSAVPVYQGIARSIGVDRMKYYTQLFGYGNLDINASNIDNFWLEGNSNITQYQQLYFLQKLYNLQLPVSDEAMNLTKQIMLHKATDRYTMSAKTGLSIRQGEKVGWFVGYVEVSDNVYFFATNITPKKGVESNDFAAARIQLTEDVFNELRIVE